MQSVLFLNGILVGYLLKLIFNLSTEYYQWYNNVSGMSEIRCCSYLCSSENLPAERFSSFLNFVLSSSVFLIVNLTFQMHSPYFSFSICITGKWSFCFFFEFTKVCSLLKIIFTHSEIYDN